jgi:intracellular multiplication protein IcmC
MRNITFKISRLFAPTVLLLASSGFAWADGPEGPSTPVTITATKLGTLMINAASEIGSLTTAISIVAYVLGAILGYSALKRFQAVSTGENLPLADPIWRMAGAAALIALPWALGIVLTSLGISSTHGIYQGAGPTSGSGTGLDTLMANFVSNIYAPAKQLMQMACYVGGAISGVIGLKRLADAGKGGNQPSSAPGGIVYLVAAAALISLAQMMDLVTSSLFGTSTTGVFTALAFVPSGIPTDQATNVFKALFNFVELIGWLAFIRGIMVMRSIAEGKSNRTSTQAFIFLVAGAIAANMYGFIKVLQTTLGLTLVS